MTDLSTVPLLELLRRRLAGDLTREVYEAEIARRAKLRTAGAKIGHERFGKGAG